MNRIGILSLALFLSFQVPKDQIAWVADKIWQNECRGSLEGLTSWNAGEAHASLGIGHFIWYPEGKSGIYVETFPELLAFLGREGVAIPPLLKAKKGCPWPSKEAFDCSKGSPEMEELRAFLFKTKELQAVFIAKRFESVVDELVRTLPPEEGKRLKLRVEELIDSPRGLFALLDYLNFKGSGLSSSERYQGKGWGLLQVLLRMEAKAKDPVASFTQAARSVLEERVRLAPRERGEERWLKGWLNRVERY